MAASVKQTHTGSRSLLSPGFAAVRPFPCATSPSPPSLASDQLLFYSSPPLLTNKIIYIKYDGGLTVAELEK